MLHTQQSNRITQQTSQQTDGWQPALAAIADLRTFDVELFKQAAKAVADELVEIQRAYEAVSEKLGLAQQRQETIDARFAEILASAALVRKSIDNDRNFASIYGVDGEAALRHVRPLNRHAN